MSLRYAPSTGRWLELDDARWAEVQADPRGPLADRLRRMGLLGEVDPAGLFPARHRRVLRLRHALWVPERPVPGGLAYRELPLDPAGARLWDAINGRRTTTDVARAAGVPLDAALARLREWTAQDAQVVQLRDAPCGPRDPGLLPLAGFAPVAGARAEDQRDGRGATTLTPWHLRIAGDRHFDRVETTVAHALRDPHPALAGAPYGRRLRERLAARGFPVDGPVVEVGCGDGALAAAWAAGDHLRIDLSPALLAAQARAAPWTLGVLADALHLPLRNGSVPLLLSNEVLADLPAVPAGAADPEVEARLARYGLARQPTWHNLGAWRFVEEVARVLAPGGSAFLSEFGDPDEPPAEAALLDHPEVGIHFGQLAAVARANGLAAELVRLDDLLGANLGAPQLARHSWLALRARWPELPARAWTPATLALPEPVDGLEWTTLADLGPGPLITRFWALLLRRDADGRAPRARGAPPRPRPARSRSPRSGA